MDYEDSVHFLQESF
jgi:uncharacterized protein YqgV (UPF0045/DUF77 family)